MRLTHSCARNADLTSSGHAVWPSLLHRPLIRSVTASLILLQTSLITSSWWEFMWIIRAWITTFYGGFRPNSIIKSTCTLVVPAGIEPATRGFSVPCSTDWATEPRSAYSPYGFRSWRSRTRTYAQAFDPALPVKLFSHINGRYCYAPAKALTIYQPCGKRQDLCNRSTNHCPWIL